MQAERIPLDRIFQQRVTAEWQRDEYRSINTKLSSFNDSLLNMRLQATYTAKTASSSDESVLIARAIGSAQIGSYNIVVEKLAQSATLISGKAEGASQGIAERFDGFLVDRDSATIKIASELVDGEPNYIEIELSGSDTIDNFVSKINNNKDLGVNAYYDQHQDALVLTSTATGENAEIRFSTEDTTTQEFLNQVIGTEETWVLDNTPGSNALISINGLSTERESNTFDLAGVEVTLNSTAPGQIVRIDVGQDIDSVFNNIKGMVDQYNELIDEINGKLVEPSYRDYPPLTEAQKNDMSEREIELWEEKARSGLLRSDRQLSNLVTNMRRALTDAVAGLEGFNSLHDIGISTGSWYENGKLHINETKLKSAIEDNPDQVMNLFTHNPSDGQGSMGIARRLETVLESGMDQLSRTAGKSTTLYDTSTLSEKIRRYDDQIATMEDRLLRVENRYWDQFTAMERALAQMNAQADWLYQQLAVME